MRWNKLVILFLSLLAGSAAQAQLIPFYSDVAAKYGYKDRNGREVVAPVYDLAYPFTEGRAAVRIAGKYGYLDESGKEVVTPKYDFTWHYIGGFATVKLDDKFGFIDLKGEEMVVPKYDDANNFHGACCYKGMAHVKEKGKWRIIKLSKQVN